MPSTTYADLWRECQSVLAAHFVIFALLALAWLIEFDRKLDHYERFIASDRMLKARFDTWKRDQRKPPADTPPTDSQRGK